MKTEFEFLCEHLGFKLAEIYLSLENENYFKRHPEITIEIFTQAICYEAIHLLVGSIPKNE